MSEEKKPFTVTDRRHFTREGEVRDTASTATAPEPAPSASRCNMNIGSIDTVFVSMFTTLRLAVS